MATTAKDFEVAESLVPNADISFVMHVTRTPTSRAIIGLALAFFASVFYVHNFDVAYLAPMAGAKVQLAIPKAAGEDELQKAD